MALTCENRSMTPAPAPAVLIPTSLPDLRDLPFGELASPEVVDKIVRRVLPRTLPGRGQEFSSSI